MLSRIFSHSVFSVFVLGSAAAFWCSGFFIIAALLWTFYWWISFYKYRHICASAKLRAGMMIEQEGYTNQVFPAIANVFICDMYRTVDCFESRWLFKLTRWLHVGAFSLGCVVVLSVFVHLLGNRKEDLNTMIVVAITCLFYFSAPINIIVSSAYGETWKNYKAYLKNTKQLKEGKLN